MLDVYPRPICQTYPHYSRNSQQCIQSLNWDSSAIFSPGKKQYNEEHRTTAAHLVHLVINWSPRLPPAAPLDPVRILDLLIDLLELLLLLMDELDFLLLDD